MKIIISRSGKALGDLYHKTSKSNAVDILRSGMLMLATGRVTGLEDALQSNYIYFASLTRSRTGSYHYGEDGSKTDDIMFTLDGTALSNRYPIKPVDYWSGNPVNSRKEAEERLLSDKRDIPIIKYIKRIDIITPAHYLRDGEYRGDADMLKRRGHSIGTIVFLAKKYKIPYGFYQNAKDWSLRRGEFYPTDMSPAKRNKYQDNYDYPQLLALYKALTTPESKLSSKDVDVWEICKHPSSAYQTFTNNKSNKHGDAILTIMGRISKYIKRAGIVGEDSFTSYLKSKYDAANKREVQAKYTKQAENVAKSIIDLMTRDRQHLTEEELSWLNDRFDSILDTKIEYYLNSYVQDYGHTPITQQAYALLDRRVLYTDDVLRTIRERFA